MREIDILYDKVEVIVDELNSYILQDLRNLKEPERESLTEAYELLVGALACIHQSAFYRQPEVDEEEEARAFPTGKPLGPKNPAPFWVKEDGKYDGYREVYPEDYVYTSEQKGEEVPEGTPIDNSNHTYFTGDERKFNWDIIYAMKKITGSNTVDYDAFAVSYAGDGTIILKNKGRAPE
jgi:hypothetical protein